MPHYIKPFFNQLSLKGFVHEFQRNGWRWEYEGFLIILFVNPVCQIQNTFVMLIPFTFL